MSLKVLLKRAKKLECKSQSNEKNKKMIHVLKHGESEVGLTRLIIRLANHETQEGCT